MRVLLADDHRLLVEGLVNLLQAHGVDVVGVAKDGFEAVERTLSLHPDVVLMDIRMPACDGLAATRLIKAERPEQAVVILTTSDEDSDLFEAIKSGANGYLLKSIDAASLVDALQDAVDGVPPLASGLAERLMAEFARGGVHSEADPRATPTAIPSTPQEHEAEPAVITPRQNEILELVAEGRSYKEIGRRLYITPRTVKYHMAEIMRKLHLENRAQVLAYAARHASGYGSGGVPRS